MTFRLRSSFRAKLLLALVGSVGVLLAVTLVAVRAQTRRQVEVAVASALERSRRAFAQQEQTRRERLDGLVEAENASNRLPAALEAATDSTSRAYLAATTSYQLSLARLPAALVAFTDASGTPVTAVVGNRVLRDPAAAVPAPLVDRMLHEGATDAAGYQLLGGVLYGVRITRFDLFGSPVGTLTLGLPVDDAVADALGESVGGEVCFAAGGRCVAASAALRGSDALSRLAARSGGGGRPTVERWRGRRLAVVSERIGADAGMQPVWRVTAVALDDVILPFERIERVVAGVGAAALALAVLLGIVLSRGLARPVRALVDATGRIARGDYAARVRATTRDELGTLAGAFNAMAEGLMLKERYRGVLDKVVSREVADELLKGEISLGGETRRVTTLFADLRGFTALTEGMEPQRVIGLLNEFMERATAAIEDEGGVVDKYVGDEVMAIFGAPLALEDDVLRAVRAALRIRRAAEELSAARVARGEEAVAVGIGINTGLAVAGNMGSARRLNYTVLGESVNVAARLCALAGPGEIIVGEAVLERVRGDVVATPRGPRPLKGLSAPVPVFAVESLRADDGAASPPPSIPLSSPAAGATALGIALAALLAAAPVDAQPLPTFEVLGIGWTSPGGSWQVTPSGRLEIEAFAPPDVQSSLIAEGDPFVAPRLSLFVDVLAGRALAATVELRADRGEAPGDRPLSARVEQAFVRLAPFAETELSLRAGKFVSPFGGWVERHASPADPFIRPPLPYDYRTVICPGRLPAGVAGFLGWMDEPATFRPIGAPVVWAAPYPTGAMLSGGWKTVSARVAVMNSAPSSEPGEWNDVSTTHGPSFVARAAWQVVPELRVGASYDRGSYLRDEPTGAPFPAGRDAGDYRQELWGVDAAFARGAVEARAEVLMDRWEVPNVADAPRDVAWYLETKVKLASALFAAARYGALRFDRVESATGEMERWDYDVRRLQLGAGYRLGRATELRAEYLASVTDAPPDGGRGQLAVRWSWGF